MHFILMENMNSDSLKLMLNYLFEPVTQLRLFVSQSNIGAIALWMNGTCRLYLHIVNLFKQAFGVQAMRGKLRKDGAVVGV